MHTVPPLPIIFCFAGQGSQYYGMAADLMDADSTFRHWMHQGDAMVKDRHGFSVLAEMHDGERRIAMPFDRMQASHPAIFMVQYALAKTLQRHGVRPDCLLGVSLGEIVAQSVSGMVSFETALAMVSDQPELFARHCPPGGMIAVLAPPSLHAEMPVLAETCEIAGINSPGHFVIAAPAEALAAAEAELRRREVVFQRLPVPYPFHSRFVDCAEEPFRVATAHLHRESPFWPVWSCCAAAATGTASPDLYWRILRQPMRVQDTLRRIETQGGAIYVDLSPSGTLAAVFRQELGPHSPSRLVHVLSPLGGNWARLEKTVATLRALAAPESLE